MNPFQGTFVVTGIIIWILIPWVISCCHIFRATIYESKIKLYSGIGPLDFSEKFRRIRERRMEDKKYDELRRKTWKWFIITMVWWIGSFVSFIAIVVIGSSIK